MNIKPQFDSKQPSRLNAIEIVARIEIERAIVHGNRELQCHKGMISASGEELDALLPSVLDRAFNYLVFNRLDKI